MKMGLAFRVAHVAGTKKAADAYNRTRLTPRIESRLHRWLAR
jgi:hypothetical protein